MSWQQLHISCTAEQAPELETFLTQQGALSITLQDAADQAIFEPAPGANIVWQAMCLTALFEADTNLTAIDHYLQQQHFTYQQEQLADQAWERKWMDDFHPMRFGERTWIVPSWQAAPDTNAVNIVLDPGLAFGTGTHPTTALCLTWLDKQALKQKTLIDFGCGSGILAIAAVKHQAHPVITIDHDPQALLATKDNAERNQLTDTDLQIYGTENIPAIQSDILVANILAQPLLSLRDQFKQLLKPNGRLVLSGILAEQKAQILSAYESQFTCTDCQQQEQWLLLEFQNN